MSNNTCSPLEGYYAFHSKIYDATRWSFLFGRNDLTRRLASEYAPQRVLEVGCGTGKNIAPLLAALPKAHVTGVDLCGSMLDVAGKNLAANADRAELHAVCYDEPLTKGPHDLPAHEPFDAVVFSYALSMFNPGFERAIECARADLVEGGIIAVVDFHATRFNWFARWMGVNHVRMEGHVLPVLERHFHTQVREVRNAYGGVWQYLTYFGEKRP